MSGKIKRAFTTAGVLALTGWVTVGPLHATAQSQSQGFITDKQSLLRPVATGVEVKPLLSVADSLSNGYTMAGIPDGLGTYDNGDGTFTLYMNHELTQPANLTDARVSKLTIKKDTLEVMDGKYIVTGIEGYRRFCSATMVGPKEGFDRPYYFTGEEDTGGKFGGLDIVIDSKNERVTQLVYTGRMSWENTIAVPGFKGKIVMMSFDDSAPGGVYMFIGNNQNDIFTGEADMYVFVADGGVRTEDKVSKNSPLTGKFVKIDKKKASLYRKGTVDEFEAAGGFKFVRPEDGTYDVNDPTQIYFNVTGRSQYTDTVTGKPYDAKGRTFAMKLDPSDPTKVTSLKPIIDGDAGDDILNPDNISASSTHLMILEDINTEFLGKRPGRVLSYEIATGKLTAVAELAHRDYAGQPIPNDILGETETSGIINVSDLLGKKDTWMLDVQAHTLKVKQFSGTDEGGQLLTITVPGTSALQQAGTPTVGASATVAPANTPAGQATSVPVASPTTGATGGATATAANNPEATTTTVAAQATATTAPVASTPTPVPQMVQPTPTNSGMMQQPTANAGGTTGGNTGMPGVPRTGSGDTSNWLYLLGGLGAALAGAGLILRRQMGRR